MVTFFFVKTFFKYIQSVLLLVCVWLITRKFKLSGMRCPALSLSPDNAVYQKHGMDIKCGLIISYTGLLISPSGISEIDCATTKTDTAERSISIGRETVQAFFCTRSLGVLPGSTARG